MRQVRGLRRFEQSVFDEVGQKFSSGLGFSGGFEPGLDIPLGRAIVDTPFGRALGGADRSARGGGLVEHSRPRLRQCGEQ